MIIEKNRKENPLRGISPDKHKAVHKYCEQMLYIIILKIILLIKWLIINQEILL